LFLIPFSDRWIVGTTDTPWELDASHPAATAHDIDTLLTSANQLLSRPLARSDVVGVYAGLRPLIQAGSSASARLSREHVVRRTDDVTTVVAGGKYTTYRVMARDAVDTAAAGLATGGQRSRTHLLPLVGADGFPAAWAGRAAAAAAAGISLGAMERLLRRHGSEYREVLAHAAGRPDLLSPIKGAAEYLRAEVVHAVTCEGARHLDDVLTRRTRISISEPSRGTAVATEVADLMAPLLGWDEAQCGAEIAQYRKRVQAELYAAQHPDDAGADAARTASSWRWSTKA
jgi:glycerol-3-phosphate dehydrogenase